MTGLARYVATTGAFLLCLAFPAADASACSCIGSGPACAAAAQATAVFVGRVTGLIDGVQFEVERALTGIRPGRITVANSNSNCAFPFTLGERYVVYAYGGNGGMLSTSMCSRNRLLSDPRSRGDIAYFDRRAKGTAEGLLTGVAGDYTRDLRSQYPPFRPLAGIRITAWAEDGRGRVHTTSTRSDGSYEMSGLPLGRVRIDARFPNEFEPHQIRSTEITERYGCAEADLGTRIRSRIRGQLHDENGRPAGNVSVQIADAALTRSGAMPLLPTIDAVTDYEGRFEFLAVGAGQYLIGVALQYPIREGKLDRRRFYPNARDIDSATVVNLGSAERLELAAFKLAPLPADRVVTILVQAPSADVAKATALFITGARREPVVHDGAPLELRLAYGAAFVIQAEAPSGFRIVGPSAVRLDRDDTDRTIEFRIQR